jgi:hypothetical protein
MKYIHVRWAHSNPDYPVDLYSELDDESWETRKVEVYADGRVGFADAHTEFGDTGLGEVPVPPLDEIARDPQFEPREISRAEFEAAWEMAHQHTASLPGRS